MAYKGTETFQLLVKIHEASLIIDDWAERNMQSNIRVRRAKTNGHVVIETKDVLFAARIKRSYPNSQVNIKE